MPQPLSTFAATVHPEPSTAGAQPLALTMGDPAGIGPEIVAACFEPEPDLRDLGPRVVLGDVAVMQRAVRVRARATGTLPLSVAVLDDLRALGQVPPNCVPVWVPPGLPNGLADLAVGQVHADAGRAAAACVRAGVRLARTGEIAGLVTAPLHKEALAAAGEPYPGHTELLADEAGEPGRPVPVRMMLANASLKTVLVTVHCSLRRAIDLVTVEAVLSTLRIAHAAARLWGQPAPRIAVAGLNPHAGEGGLFGDEELTVIGPAIALACAEGIHASGPWAPDTVFMRARQGDFDLVIAQYHDQGLIPVKYLGLDDGVNVTLGLPFVRTSPDHGTAFDLAGRGVADPASLRAAIRMARQLVAGAA
jgi:4-hydroxythreonine-4-phosphate dehydrogenase